MATMYTIYLVNNSTTTQTFWCFLARPEELASDSSVFANSSTSLSVPSMSPGVNTFTIPVQYVAAAGASNNAVGRNIQINSTTTNNAELGQTWDVNYADAPPPMGPIMMLDAEPSPLTALALKSNGFDQGSNEAAGWFSSMSFGIQTAQGFVGMTWSPSPAQTRTITPLLQFYVAVGSFGDNSLADWTDVSNSSAQISVPGSFAGNKTTVTYTSRGGWTVTPGAPALAEAELASGTRADVEGLVKSHVAMSEAHAGLIDIVRSLIGREPADDSDVSLLAAPSSQSDTSSTSSGLPRAAAPGSIPSPS